MMLHQIIPNLSLKQWQISGVAAHDELSLHITFTAEHDIMRAVDYIEFVLKNPQAADNLLDAVTKQIGTLSDFPQKFHIVDDPVLASWEIRFVIINNYLAFYTINEEKKTVTVVRFLYKKSNWCSILRQGFSLV